MSKLSLNVVPNVYNSLQSSFLSLALPWPGRSLPRGNQWEWWDPGQGPLPGLGEVGHSLRGTSGSAGTLDWGPIWLSSQFTYHPLCPLTPICTLLIPWYPYTLTPLMPHTPANGSAETLDWGPMWSGSQSNCHPNAPWCHLHPWCPYTP